MKAKLVKYPFDEKKYRWDTYKLGKEFEYYWDESLPNNFETIEPYIKVEPFVYDSSKDYSYVDITKEVPDFNELKPQKQSTNIAVFPVNPVENEYIYSSHRTYHQSGATGGYYGYNGFTISYGINNLNTVNIDITGGTKNKYMYSIVEAPNSIIQSKRYCHYRQIIYPYDSKYVVGYKESVGDGRYRTVVWASPSSTSVDVDWEEEYTTTTNISLTDVYEAEVLGGYFTRGSLTIGNNTWNVEYYGREIYWENYFYCFAKYGNNPNDYNYVLPFQFETNQPITLLTIDTSNYSNYFDERLWNRIITQQPSLDYILNIISPLTINQTLFYYGLPDVPYNMYITYGTDKLEIKADIGSYIKYFEGYTLRDPQWGQSIGSQQQGVTDKRILNFNFLQTHNIPVFDATYTSQISGISSHINTSETLVVDYFTDGAKRGAAYGNALLNPPYFIMPQIDRTGKTIKLKWSARNDEIYMFHKVNGYQTNEYNIVSNTLTITPNQRYLDIKNSDYVMESSNWNTTLYNCVPITSSVSNKKLITDLCLIGDKTENTITIPSGNTDIYKYALGEGINRQFVAKPLQYNAPCEYSNGVVSSKTWLTFNSYTSSQWNNGFHFEGNQWNNIGSPFAYINGITSSAGNRKMVYTYDVAEPGTYENIFNLINGGFEVSDSDGNDYITSTDTLNTYRHYYDDNVGSLWYFGTGTVSSTDRNAYPDNGSQGDFTYRLRPQNTKFLRYYRTRDELTNVELYSDRYKYTHDTVDFCDRSLEGTTIGTTTSTNEESIPDGTWREYLGLYLGTSIPFLGIVETEIPPADILGVPQYDKQVNTSDTLKYGTVASASLTFTLNKPVGETLTHNNELLILYYDFKHRDEWERLGFFRVDSIEALDENTTSLMAHDEVYKLNKYVDDFLEDYTQTTTLDLFYRDLLNYCDCFYDTHQDIIHNGTLGMTNVYHAVKTTGVQVAHYVANLSPGFIHANIDGDVVLQQYQLKDDNLTIADYSNLVYTAYNTDMLNKIKIVSSNTVKGEDRGTGANVYFLADNPLLSELQATSYFNELAQDILEVYEDIPTYRPATVDFLILPRELKIGDIVNLTTPKNETYKVIVMAMTISSSGVQIKSFGTQSFPVEAESNSEFVNLINDMGEISGDVSNMMEAQRTMANAIAENTEHIGTNTADIAAIKQKNTQQDTSIGNNASAISALQTLTNGFGVSVASNLATIALNGSTPNVAMKGYVDSKASTAETNAKTYAKNYADGLIGTSVGYKTGTLRWGSASATTATNSVHCMYIGTNDKRNGIFIPTAFVADDYNRTYMFRVYNGSYFILYDDGYSAGARVGWFAIGSVSFTED